VYKEVKRHPSIVVRSPHPFSNKPSKNSRNKASPKRRSLKFRSTIKLDDGSSFVLNKFISFSNIPHLHSKDKSKELIANNEDQEDDELNINENESKIGKQLSMLSTTRLILIVLIMICIVPLFASETYHSHEKSFIYGLEELVSLSSANLNNITLIQMFFDQFTAFQSRQSQPLIFCYLAFSQEQMSKNFTFSNPEININDFRTPEMQAYYIELIYQNKT